MTITGNTFGDNHDADIAIVENSKVNNYEGKTLELSQKNNGAAVKSFLEQITVEDGTLSVEGEYDASEATGVEEIVLGNPNATVKGPEGLNVTTAENDYVIYDEEEGVYSVVDTEVFASNMTLGNTFDLNFWLREDDLSDNVEDYYAVVTKNGQEIAKIDGENWDLKTYDIPGETGNEYYLIPFTGLAAKEMADEFIVTIYNGAEAESGAFIDSMRMNAENLIKDENRSTELRAAMVDMLNYGAAAQQAFGYNTGNPANAGIDDYQDLATTEYNLTNEWNGGSIGYGSNLELKENIILHVWFKAANVAYAKVTYTDHNGNAISSGEITEFDDRISGVIKSVAIDTLVVADGFAEVTVEFFDAQDNSLGVVKESVESYLKYMLEKDSGAAPLYNAIAKFITSSYNFFH